MLCFKITFPACLALYVVLAITDTVASPVETASGNVPTCTPESAGDVSVDDTPSIRQAIQDCGQGGVIILPSDTIYNMRTKIDMDGCSGCEIRLDGTLKASDDLGYWNTTSEMVLFSNVQTALFWSPSGKGTIDSNGQSSYDAFATGVNVRRPVSLSVGGAQSQDISFKGINIRNPHAAFVYVGHGAKHISFEDMDMTAVSTSQYEPSNTDGFDIGVSQYVSLKNVNILNQDDCVAFKPGCDQIFIENITCDGSHGLSVGSLAKYPGNVDYVTNVLVRGAFMKNSSKAMGVKIYPGGPTFGSAVISNVTWEDISINNCDAGFQLEACYFPPNRDRAYCGANSSPSKIDGVVVRNMTGTVNGRYNGETGYVYCPVEGEDCQVHMENINVASTVSPSNFKCDKVGDLGIPCVQVDPY